MKIHAEMYKWRHLAENHFAKIKEFHGIIMCYDKVDDGFRANINLTVTHRLPIIVYGP